MVKIYDKNIRIKGMNQHPLSSSRDYISRASYGPTTPQLRRFDYGQPQISPTLPRHHSPIRNQSPTRRILTQPYTGHSQVTSMKQPMSESDSVSLPQILYLQKSPLETHKCRMKDKLKYGLLSLTTLCFISVITGYFSYSHSISDLYKLTTEDKTEIPESIFGYHFYLWRNLKQMIFVASWTTFLTSIGVLFIVGGQLICALKLSKSNPDSPALSLRFLVEGKLIRTSIVFVWFISLLFFIFVSPSTIWYLPVQSVPKTICAAMGLVVGILCLFSAVQSIYGLCKSDYLIPSNFSMDERFDIDAGGHYAKTNNGVNFSTLV